MDLLSTTKPISSIDQCCYSCCNAFFFLRPRIIPSSTPPPPPPYPISMLNSSSTRKSVVVCHSSKESSALVMSHLHNATTKLNIARRRMRRRRRRSLLVFCNTNGGNSNEDENDGGPGREAEEEKKEEEVVSPENKAIINACLVGLFTGIGVVLFNIAVHEIRDVFWDGIPDRGASWLREEPIGVKWGHVILIPACGGLLVSMLKLFQTAIEEPKNWNLSSNVKATLDPIFKAVAACITLGTGNSLGPEGPSVEIGASIAKGVGTLFDNSSQGKLSLKAAGSAAGIASGFNAAVAGCFFAVEVVLWPSPAESSSSLTNTTSMVILSAVIASVVSEIGLGSEPAFIVPNYEFRSPSELPLYLLLGTVCGLVSLTLSQCTTFMRVAVDNIEKITGVPNTIFPIFGGFTVGLMALAYPEILYWGFENVDLLLESRPLVEVLSVNLLLQIVAVKILATSLCRASGLVGGYYAPSLFIGAATGMAYGKVVSFVFSQSNPIFHLPFLEVASPQAYGLVGMAATLAGVCQVPLTAVLLLFELTQDYRIVLPLLGAVGLSSWITSGQTRRKGVVGTKKVNNENAFLNQQPEISSSSSPLVSSANSVVEKASDESNLGELGRLLYLGGPNDNTNGITHRILVAQAMRTRYATVMMSTSVAEAVSLMLAEKQSCAAIVDDKDLLIGLLTLANIQQFTELSKAKTKSPKELTVSEVCAPEGEECQIPLSVTPNMSLLSAQTLMYRHRMSQVPVVQDQGHPVGLLDNECISLICRGLAIGERLQQFPTLERLKN
ncbi:chloride channel protein CLC-e-like isoform X1 [Coffea arabica]|uniref:Chloride channel protein n=1 Tax=Coffea arabica TaxID=13443 RepID=A0A6P6WRR7_COFAR